MNETSVNPESESLSPSDEFDRNLVENVHPADWVNPKATGRYNLVIIGAGTAGLVTASISAALGARVALIERHFMGGDCLNVGCVPSKAVIRAARAWASFQDAGEFGMRISGATQYDFGAVMARMRKLRARLSPTDSASRFRDLGVDVFFGEGRFSSRDAVGVAGETLRFTRAVLCTGTRAVAPPIPGLDDAGYLTNKNFFALTDLPPRLALIGAGPIGCEMAQAFARFGSRVSLFEQMGQILPREDRDAAGIVQKEMMKDGVSIFLGTRLTHVERRGSQKVIRYETKEGLGEIVVDQILVGVGRAPNVEGLGLEKAGVAYDLKTGIRVNDRLQTTNPRIFAAGDVCSVYKFTHAADALAQIVVQNALFPHPFGLGYAKADALVVPWCTYTTPVIAHVGLSEAEAREKGIEVQTFSHPLEEVDRAILDGAEQGFIRVHVKKGTDRILGATLVAPHAGDLISEITLAMKAGAGLGTISGTIHPYPTQAEMIRKVANAWRKTALTETKKKILGRWFSWRRGGFRGR